MTDRNVSPYLKLNEIVYATNAHSEYLRQLDELFVKMACEPGLWGWLTRQCFKHFLTERTRPYVRMLPFIDVPPVVGDTLEISVESPTVKARPIRG